MPPDSPWPCSRYTPAGKPVKLSACARPPHQREAPDRPPHGIEKDDFVGPGGRGAQVGGAQSRARVGPQLHVGRSQGACGGGHGGIHPKQHDRRVRRQHEAARVGYPAHVEVAGAGGQHHRVRGRRGVVFQPHGIGLAGRHECGFPHCHVVEPASPGVFGGLKRENGRRVVGRGREGDFKSLRGRPQGHHASAGRQAVVGA